MTDPSRRKMRKIHSVQGLEEYMGAWNFVALDRPHTISIRTDGRRARACAEMIADRVL
ncbi:MAG TPA: hypothetical protein VK858_04495 [Longimicrobiales bacterium]|nr:hypothetical protein [Longimicrobiales bacterium]